MLFGRIRWNKGYGSPIGDPCSGFRSWSGAHCIPIPHRFRRVRKLYGTGIWKVTTASAPCWAASFDEGELCDVVGFTVPDVHLNGFPDGKYRIKPELTGNWGQSRIQQMLGYKQIEPLAYYVSLTKDRHIVSVDFEVVQHAWGVHLSG
jgi:hypothetical protein